MAIATYLNALVRDKKAYEQKLKDYGMTVENLSFTELNKKLNAAAYITNLSQFNFRQAPCENLDYEIKKIKFDSVSNYNNMFQESEITSINLSLINMTNAVNTFYMFAKCPNLSTVEMGGLDVTNITNAWMMFGDCPNLISLKNSGSLNFCNAYRMSLMFRNCYNLVSIDVSNWNTSNLFGAHDMFRDCYNLVSIDVSNWNTSNLQLIYSMFARCNNLSNDSLKGLCNLCLNMVNRSAANKNLSNQHPYSPLLYTNKQINTSTVGQELVDKLTNAGWTL